MEIFPVLKCAVASYESTMDVLSAGTEGHVFLGPVYTSPGWLVSPGQTVYI